MEQREVPVKQQKFAILYQTRARDNTRSATVYPATGDGLEKALNCIMEGARSVLFITAEVPNASDILNFCHDFIANGGKHKVLQT